MPIRAFHWSVPWFASVAGCAAPDPRPRSWRRRASPRSPAAARPGEVVSRVPGPDEIAARGRAAEQVVVATVVGVEPRAVVNEYGDEIIVSDTTVVVEESLRGGLSSPASTLRIEVEGGTLGELTLDVSDMPVLEVGDRGVFFVDRSPRGGHRLHGRAGGLFRLESDQVVDEAGATGLTLDHAPPDLAGAGGAPVR